MDESAPANALRVEVPQANTAHLGYSLCDDTAETLAAVAAQPSEHVRLWGPSSGRLGLGRGVPDGGPRSAWCGGGTSGETGRPSGALYSSEAMEELREDAPGVRASAGAGGRDSVSGGTGTGRRPEPGSVPDGCRGFGRLRASDARSICWPVRRLGARTRIPRRPA